MPVADQDGQPDAQRPDQQAGVRLVLAGAGVADAAGVGLADTASGLAGALGRRVPRTATGRRGWPRPAPTASCTVNVIVPLIGCPSRRPPGRRPGTPRRGSTRARPPTRCRRRPRPARSRSRLSAATSVRVTALPSGRISSPKTNEIDAGADARVAPSCGIRGLELGVRLGRCHGHEERERGQDPDDPSPDHVGPHAEAFLPAHPAPYSARSRTQPTKTSGTLLGPGCASWHRRAVASMPGLLALGRW